MKMYIIIICVFFFLHKRFVPVNDAILLRSISRSHTTTPSNRTPLMFDVPVVVFAYYLSVSPSVKIVVYYVFETEFMSLDWRGGREEGPKRKGLWLIVAIIRTNGRSCSGGGGNFEGSVNNKKKKKYIPICNPNVSVSILDFPAGTHMFPHIYVFCRNRHIVVISVHCRRYTRI